MQNKLQELTDKLYNEGLARGKQEGEAILRDARAQAEKIISDARTEAAGIVADAGKKAEELRTKVEGDLKMAAGQSIAATKQRIETLLVNKMADASVSEALSSADFVKQIIKTVASAFNPAGGGAADLHFRTFYGRCDEGDGFRQKVRCRRHPLCADEENRHKLCSRGASRQD